MWSQGRQGCIFDSHPIWRDMGTSSRTFCSREEFLVDPPFSVQNTTGWIIVNCLNLVTIAIPPALPLALSIGLSVSFTRLQTKKIFCINPPRIVNAGRVNTACFDKTGTLTEDGLSLRGVCAVQEANGGSALALSDIQADVQKLYLEAHQVRNGRLPLLDGGEAREEAEAEVPWLLRGRAFRGRGSYEMRHLCAEVCNQRSGIVVLLTIPLSALDCHVVETSISGGCRSNLLEAASTAPLLFESSNSCSKAHVCYLQTCSDSQSSSVFASRLALSHILAACHGLSLLDQTAEEAPEEDLGKGRPGPRRSWRALLGLESGLAFHRHHDQVQPESVALEERSGPAAPSFVGDPLEVQMFAQTGTTPTADLLTWIRSGSRDCKLIDCSPTALSAAASLEHTSCFQVGSFQRQSMTVSQYLILFHSLLQAGRTPVGPRSRLFTPTQPPPSRCSPTLCGRIPPSPPPAILSSYRPRRRTTRAAPRSRCCAASTSTTRSA